MPRMPNFPARPAPCRDCGEVKPHSVTTGEEDFCIDCAVEQWFMRRITLAPERYCPHCDQIRPAPGESGHYAVVWREEPTCLACGAAAYFPQLEPDHVAPLCIGCEAARAFEGDPCCPACGAIADYNLEDLLAYLWEIRAAEREEVGLDEL
jgi:hypothetical protein